MLPRLPVELQLIIFKDTSLSTFDLIRLNATTSHWQKIILSKIYFQERLFLRPLGTFHSSPNFIGLVIKVTIRRIPYTIWNGVEKPLYEMTVRTELDPTRQSAEDTYLNPVLRNLGHWMHIVNPNFKHHERLETSYGHAIKPLPTLRFKDAQELRELLAPAAHTAADADASWRKMLVSTAPVHQFYLHWSLLARFSARHSWFSGNHGSYGQRTLRTDKGTTLGDHVEVFRDLLRKLPVGQMMQRAGGGLVPWWWWW
ncbi:hypothetical protein BDU57DRAFT_517873 [Ampelomyces quisqualis]|uniref:F-box domain-containing protein n=1 Tax=Ampelomyces quisqualis TaxID=50730 RepID=A0A6A5QHT6_AMPQU|nr:hypothetical protein BDU57DRAFT_517873 [Ampelomyces quisqualis]